MSIASSCKVKVFAFVAEPLIVTLSELSKSAVNVPVNAEASNDVIAPPVILPRVVFALPVTTIEVAEVTVVVATSAVVTEPAVSLTALILTVS